jgi:hypothetical protein
VFFRLITVETKDEGIGADLKNQDNFCTVSIIGLTDAGTRVMSTASSKGKPVLLSF